MLKQRVRKAFFVLIIVLVFYTFLESILAITGVSESLFQKMYTDVYDYAYELAPDVEFPLGNEPSVIWKVNRHGFRGPEINQKKPDGTFRIFCVGDSTTAGHFLDYEQTYCAKLGEMLKGKIPGYKRVQTINAGIPGTAITQQNYYIRKKITQFLPNIIVLYVVPSLSPDLVALFTLKEKMHNDPVSSIDRIKKTIRRFHLYRLFRRIIKGDVRREIRSNMEIIKSGIDTDAEYEQSRLALFQDDLQQFVSLCRAHNIIPVLVQNVNEAVCQKLTKEHALPGTDQFKHYFSTPEAIFIKYVMDFAKTDQTAFINPYNVFVPLPLGSELFFDDGVHPKESGHQLLAEVIAAKIIELKAKR